jgi:hypothetical protein
MSSGPRALVQCTAVTIGFCTHHIQRRWMWFLSAILKIRIFTAYPRTLEGSLTLLRESQISYDHSVHKRKFSLTHGTTCATISMRHQFDGDTIDTTRYGHRKLEAFHSDDMHCFGKNMLSVEDDTLIAWWMKRRVKKKVTSSKYWALS